MSETQPRHFRVRGFPIDYVATDTAGNTATSTRTVIVESPAAAEPAPTL